MLESGIVLFLITMLKRLKRIFFLITSKLRIRILIIVRNIDLLGHTTDDEFHLVETVLTSTVSW